MTSPISFQLNSSPKTMPITPTVARIKSDPANVAASSGVLSSASLISPDLQRVKVEIGQARHVQPSPAALAMQQLQHQQHSTAADSPHFISPRKRMSMENGSSPVPLKKHRLSTDSR